MTQNASHVGTDGTGQSILSQLPRLEQDGWEVWTLYLPVEEQSGWSELTARTGELIRQLVGKWRYDADMHGSSSPAVTLMGESFGGCLALRVALWEPMLVERLVLLNPATCFNRWDPSP